MRVLTCVVLALCVATALGASAGMRGSVRANRSVALMNSGSYSAWSGYMYGMFAYAAYCPSSELDSWSCYVCNGQTTTSSFTVLGYMTNSADDLFGYVGYDSSNNQLLVVFRGTVASDLENWILDLKSAGKMTYPDNSAVQVADGFYDAYSTLESQMDNIMQSALNQYSGVPIVVAGHSLGAAMATLAAAHLSSYISPSSLSLYTIGCPRVGDPNFASWFNSIGFATVWRIVNDADIVPHVPPMELGFQHVPTEVWYTSSSDYTQCNGSGEDPNCSDSLSFPVSISDHLSYFGVQESCS